MLNLWTGLGLCFLLLAAVGVVVPLLPTTPFVLLAAGCFARSSPRLHRWLLNSTLFGPSLHHWEQHRCLSCRVKRVALGSMLLVGGTSLLLVQPRGWVQALALLGLATGCAAVLALRTCPAPADSGSEIVDR